MEEDSEVVDMVVVVVGTEVAETKVAMTLNPEMVSEDEEEVVGEVVAVIEAVVVVDIEGMETMMIMVEILVKMMAKRKSL